MTAEASREFYETVARFYDAENIFFTEDLALYSELAAETDGPILDVGAGTGRVTFHLAQEGHRVFGVEISEDMLARAKRKLAVMPELKDRIVLQGGDILKTEFHEQFGLIIVPYNTFMHMRTQAMQLKVLGQFSRWLRPDGLIVIDIPNPGDLYATQDDGSVVLERTFHEPESGHLVMQHSVSEMDRAAQIMYITWIYDEIFDDGTVHRTLAPLTLRYYFPAEVDLLLKLSGLARVDFYGDYDGSPFEDGSARMVTVARKQGE